MSFSEEESLIKIIFKSEQQTIFKNYACANFLYLFCLIIKTFHDTRQIIIIIYDVTNYSLCLKCSYLSLFIFSFWNDIKNTCLLTTWVEYIIKKAIDSQF